MKKSIDTFLTYFEGQLQADLFDDKNIIWFRRSVYALLLLKMLSIWPEIDMFYRHAISVGKGSLLPYELMFLPAFYDYYNVYWLVVCAIVAYAIYHKGNSWLSMAVFIIGINYLSLEFKAINFGDKLLNFLMFMLIFVREGAVKHSIRQMVNNAVLLIIEVHFCLLYFLNAYGKVIRPFWRNGSFFKDIWSMSYYANVNLIPDWFFNPILQLLTAWSVIIFEFIFPVLIWFKPYRKPLIFIGVLFHLGIAILLSLPDFGISMMVVYVLFFDFKKANNSDSLITD